jgi:hypothetical protein
VMPCFLLYCSCIVRRRFVSSIASLIERHRVGIHDHFAFGARGAAIVWMSVVLFLKTPLSTSIIITSGG